MKIGFFDISCRRQFAWSVKACFLGKIKHISNCRLQKYWPSMLSVKQTTNLVDFPPILTRKTVFMVSMPVWFPAYQAPSERGVYSKRKQFNPNSLVSELIPFFRRERIILIVAFLVIVSNPHECRLTTKWMICFIYFPEYRTAFHAESSSPVTPRKYKKIKS